MNIEQAVLDRVEDQRHAVLLIGPTEKEKVVPINQIPPDCKPGDWLVLETDSEGKLTIRANPAITEQTGQRIKAKMNLLKQRGRKL